MASFVIFQTDTYSQAYQSNKTRAVYYNIYCRVGAGNRYKLVAERQRNIGFRNSHLGKSVYRLLPTTPYTLICLCNMRCDKLFKLT